MSRSRAFIFRIEPMTTDEWNNVVELKECAAIEYLCASIDSMCINGFIRFKHAKLQSYVIKLFKGKAILKPESNNDAQIKSMCESGKKFFEHGIIPKNVRPKPSESELKEALTTQQHMIENLTSQITEICKTVALNNPISVNNINITNNNTNNVKFNLNFFLNEQCKDAMNITEFSNTIPIGIDDVMYFKNHKHVDAITRIVEKAFTEMDVTKRPIHCTDLKRETLHVKNDNKWINDQSKALTTKAFETITNRSLRGMALWRHANPDHAESEAKKNEYAILMRNMIGGTTEKQIEDNQAQFVRNISRLTHIQKR